MKKMTIKRWIAGCMTAALLVTMVPQTEVEASDQTSVAAADEQLPTGGALAFTEAQIVGTLTDHAASKTGGTRLQSIRSSLSVYDWDCYSSDYYYSKLSKAEREFYERMDAACGQLLTSSVSAEQYEINRNGTNLTVYGTKTLDTEGLSDDQIAKVYEIFVYANPQYYFISNNRYVGDSTLSLGVYDIFADGSARASATAQVERALQSMCSQIDSSGTVYETELQIHALICGSLSYNNAADEADISDPYYSQTIYGALTTGSTVCAGYAKLYELLCNYFGIDCIVVTSSSHAWNLVRYGSAWYVVDATWDDSSKDRMMYFHLSDAQMNKKDQKSAHIQKSFYYGIRPGAGYEFSDAQKTLYGLEQPEISVEATAEGVTITMEASTGSVYYTLDGSTPDTGSLYSEPIELDTAGDYVLTAVTLQSGYLASAYEIIPVRVADGSVTISTLKNKKTRQLRVTVKKSSGLDGYELSYASKRNFSNQKCAKLSSTAVRIKKLVKGRIYYVRVRGYRIDAYGNYYYTPYSVTRKIKVVR